MAEKPDSKYISKYYMSNRKLVLQYLSFFVLTMVTNAGYCQWSGVYGNEWIDYSKSYIRIAVKTKGVHRVELKNLPADFSKNYANYQLWHRGKEVAIISANASEILFYGEPNDGSSDSLLFRPMSAKMDQNVSFFSDESSYFLTSGTKVKRAEMVDGTSLNGIPEPYHIFKETVTLKSQFSQSTLTLSPVTLNQSFYDNTNSWTGPVIYGAQAVNHNATNIFSYTPLSLVNLVQTPTAKPSIQFMLNGLHFGTHAVTYSVGRNKTDGVQRIIGTSSFTGLGAKLVDPFVLEPGDWSDRDSLYLKLTSNTSNTYDWYGLSYYTLSYPQRTEIVNGKATYLNLPPSASKTTRIAITNVPGTIRVYDISDKHSPRVLEGKLSGSTYELMVPREIGKWAVLAAIPDVEIQTVVSEKISAVSFQPIFSTKPVSQQTINPEEFDYLIVTSENLKESAIKYSEYRSSSAGGGFRILTMGIKNIYNQFNYGEPSAVAIKRFVDYMLKSGIRERHNLLLIGFGVSAADAAQTRLVKEMPDEVPTIGDPGSDILLVSGLRGANEDVPVIPVGRINALKENYVVDYLEKVKKYEAETSDLSWQKRILHLNGGKTSSEISEFSNILKDLVPLVEKGELGGMVKPFIKQSTIETERVDISPEVNEGVGMVTYFGHGYGLGTDLDMGFASDASRNYNNTNLTFMYFNGCGVGNIYQSRRTTTLSTDWVVVPTKGAIAVLANSFNSYPASLTKYLKLLYAKLFNDPVYHKSSIGKIIIDTGKEVISQNPSAYDIANLHQTNLQGDPAIRLFRLDKPDYAIKDEGDIILYSESEDKTIAESRSIRTAIVIRNEGKYVKEDKPVIRIKYIHKNGTTNQESLSVDPVAYQDTLFFPSVNTGDLTRIEVKIDPEGTLDELSRNNNSGELEVNWEIAKLQRIYKGEYVKDIIAPVLNVTINGSSIKNGDWVSPNPTIDITLTDDRPLDLDTNLVDVYIKPCFDETCSYQKVSYKELIAENPDSRTLKIKYVTNFLNDGEYQLLVLSKDKSANQSIAPYQINFRIKTETGKSIIASPNPASSYVRFSYEVEEDITSVELDIINSRGVVMERLQIKDFSQGMNQWYWLPDRVPAGIYFYRFKFANSEQGKRETMGKLIIIK